MKIQKFITNEVIRTQEELAEKLINEGFTVTQATISRDIKEMGLVKILGPDDEYRYALQGGESHPISYYERLKRMCKESVISYDSSENLVVIKTIPGNAQALAFLIDNVNWEEVIGTLAGDDAIFMVVKPMEDTEKVLKRISDIIG